MKSFILVKSYFATVKYHCTGFYLCNEVSNYHFVESFCKKNIFDQCGIISHHAKAVTKKSLVFQKENPQIDLVFFKLRLEKKWL